jgi:hypothetical protein
MPSRAPHLEPPTPCHDNQFEKRLRNGVTRGHVSFIEKLIEPDNFFALQLYDTIQDKHHLVLSYAEDAFAGEQSRARRTIQLYASSLSLHAQDGGQVLQWSSQPTQVSGLVVAGTRRTTVEGTDGIEITFDQASAERLLRFTHDAVGRRMIFFLNRKKLATLRLLDRIEDGNVLLTGDLDSEAVNQLFSGGAVMDVAFE